MKNSQTPCDGGGPELLPVTIRVRPNAVIDFVMHVCLAAARVQIFLDRGPLGEADGQDEFRLRLPPLPTGVHSLSWSHLTPSPTWKTRTEVSVDQVVKFRTRNASEEANPVNSGFLIIEVVQ